MESPRALKQQILHRNPHASEAAVFQQYMETAFAYAQKSDAPAYLLSDYFESYNLDNRALANVRKQKHLRVTRDALKAVTQLFTPKRLAAYLMQTALLEKLTDLNAVKKLRLLDPAAGTGNLLYEAAETLWAYYEKEGVPAAEIRALLKEQIIGLEIDPRAAAVAKRLFAERFGFQLTLPVPEDTPAFVAYLQESGLRDTAAALAGYPECGALTAWNPEEIAVLRAHRPPAFLEETQTLLAAAAVTAADYDVVLMNPPYLSSSDFSPAIAALTAAHYKDFRADLFSVFTARGFAFLKEGGALGVVCPYNWMFLKQFRAMRKAVVEDAHLTHLAMLPADGYKNAVVYLSAFAVRKQQGDGITRGIRVAEKEGGIDALLAPQKVYLCHRTAFTQNPYGALIFWTGEAFRKNYEKGRLCDVLDIRQGMATGDNKRFLRRIEEVAAEDIAFEATDFASFDKSGKRYALYNKGGPYRKWYGNRSYVILFDKEARETLALQGNHMPSRSYYFKPCITWTLVSSKGYFGARYSQNSVFDVGGSCGFQKGEEPLLLILAFLCSNVASYYLNAQNPTLNCQVGDLKNLPYIFPPASLRAQMLRLAEENVRLAKRDWHETLTPKETQTVFAALQKNETELNRIFIRLYGLEEEVSPEVPQRLITLKNKRS